MPAKGQKRGRPPGLTERQRRFVQEYIIDLNASAAAGRAGFSERSRGRQAMDLLKKAHVQAAIQSELAKRSQRTGVTQDQVIDELALVAFSSVEHYTMGEDGKLTTTADAPRGAMRAVSSVKFKERTIPRRDGDPEIVREVEFRLWDKNAALTNLGKHLGMFNEPERPPQKVEVELTW